MLPPVKGDINWNQNASKLLSVCLRRFLCANYNRGLIVSVMLLFPRYSFRYHYISHTKSFWVKSVVLNIPGKKSSAHLKVLVHINKPGINMAYVLCRCLEESLCNDFVNKKAKTKEHWRKHTYFKGIGVILKKWQNSAIFVHKSKIFIIRKLTSDFIRNYIVYTVDWLYWLWVSYAYQCFSFFFIIFEY